MFEVYNERTGERITLCRSLEVASKRAQSMTDMQAWIDGQKFSWRVV